MKQGKGKNLIDKFKGRSLEYENFDTPTITNREPRHNPSQKESQPHG
jgi:hypothetical protein